jgi:hypothetical protein
MSDKEKKTTTTTTWVDRCGKFSNVLVLLLAITAVLTLLIWHFVWLPRRRKRNEDRMLERCAQIKDPNSETIFVVLYGTYSHYPAVAQAVINILSYAACARRVRIGIVLLTDDDVLEGDDMAMLERSIHQQHRRAYSTGVYMQQCRTVRLYRRDVQRGRMSTIYTAFRYLFQQERYVLCVDLSTRLVQDWDVHSLSQLHCAEHYTGLIHGDDKRKHRILLTQCPSFTSPVMAAIQNKRIVEYYVSRLRSRRWQKKEEDPSVQPSTYTVFRQWHTDEQGQRWPRFETKHAMYFASKPLPTAVIDLRYLFGRADILCPALIRSGTLPWAITIEDLSWMLSHDMMTKETRLADCFISPTMQLAYHYTCVDNELDKPTIATALETLDQYDVRDEKAIVHAPIKMYFGIDSDSGHVEMNAMLGLWSDYMYPFITDNPEDRFFAFLKQQEMLAKYGNYSNMCIATERLKMERL